MQGTIQSGPDFLKLRHCLLLPDLKPDLRTFGFDLFLDDVQFANKADSHIGLARFFVFAGCRFLGFDKLATGVRPAPTA